MTKLSDYVYNQRLQLNFKFKHNVVHSLIAEFLIKLYLLMIYPLFTKFI